ncbi:hypothetical protein B1R94_02375 [Mycolicibacterium litorale]|nr:hypothetical protein B1R94_02375 [Mycolicibacterium litorale]
MDFTEPNVCVDENLTSDDAGMLTMQPWAVPRLVADVRALSGGDGALFPEQALPGKLLIDRKVGWRSDSPLESMVLLRVTRASRSWITSNPNAIQFRDRWTYTIDPDDITPTTPIATGIYNSQVGSAIDLGTNSVAEPNPGRQWVWSDVNCVDEWLGPVPPGEKLNIWYRAYVWTPPPFSDNANKNAPLHRANAGWVRLQLIAFPTQGTLVAG